MNIKSITIVVVSVTLGLSLTSCYSTSGGYVAPVMDSCADCVCACGEWG